MRKADIIIATYNGAKTLPVVLDSLTRSTLPKDQWRLLVMNNNSTDHTRAVVESYADKLPVEVIDVTTPGKSKAQNAGIALTDAEYILFTDDDVKLAPEWAAALIHAGETQPDYDIFTGMIIGQWEKEPDTQLKNWIPLGSTYAIHERTESGDCDPGKVWGPNMMYRKCVFENGHRFNEAIGPVPAPTYAMGEDSELAVRASESGHKVYFSADAKVIHTIEADTVNEDWIVRRAERLGLGIFALYSGEKAHKNRIHRALPMWLDILLMRMVWTCAYPFTYALPYGKLRFWSRWRYFYFKGLWNSYKAFGAKAS